MNESNVSQIQFEFQVFSPDVIARPPGADLVVSIAQDVLRFFNIQWAKTSSVEDAFLEDAIHLVNVLVSNDPRPSEASCTSSVSEIRLNLGVCHAIAMLQGTMTFCHQLLNRGRIELRELFDLEIPDPLLHEFGNLMRWQRAAEADWKTAPEPKECGFSGHDFWRPDCILCDCT